MTDGHDQDAPTDDMVKAGVTALLATEIGAGTESEIVIRVYRAMRQAARGEVCDELVPNGAGDTSDG